MLWEFREDIFMVLVANRIHQLVDFVIFVSLSRVDQQAFFEKKGILNICISYMNWKLF